ENAPDFLSGRFHDRRSTSPYIMLYPKTTMPAPFPSPPSTSSADPRNPHSHSDTGYHPDQPHCRPTPRHRYIPITRCPPYPALKIYCKASATRDIASTHRHALPATIRSGRFPIMSDEITVPVSPDIAAPPKDALPATRPRVPAAP